MTTKAEVVNINRSLTAQIEVLKLELHRLRSAEMDRHLDALAPAPSRWAERAAAARAEAMRTGKTVKL